MRHGFLSLDKPAGPTSHDVVAEVRGRLSERKIGHLGTLDPAAEGLLVLAVGAKALKVVELFVGLSKEYEADVAFGAVSTTYDREGVLEESPDRPGWAPPDSVQLQNIIRDRFTGKIIQVPPAFSAVKIGGERAYRKMRQAMARGDNAELAMPERTVTIESCEILSYAFPDLRLRIRCSSGTYIRSLAHDLGQVLGCGGYLAALKRTKVGAWTLGGAVAPGAASWTDVLPLKEILAPMPRVELTAGECDDVRCGRDIAASVVAQTIGWFDGLPVAVLMPAGQGRAHARKVL